MRNGDSQTVVVPDFGSSCVQVLVTESREFLRQARDPQGD